MFYTVNKTKTVATLVHEPWSNTPSRGNEEVEPPGGHSPSPCSPKRGWKTASDATDARRLQASEASEAAEESTYMCIYICICIYHMHMYMYTCCRGELLYKS